MGRYLAGDSLCTMYSLHYAMKIFSFRKIKQTEMIYIKQQLLSDEQSLGCMCILISLKHTILLLLFLFELRLYLQNIVLNICTLQF